MSNYVCKECGSEHKPSQVFANRHICPACGFQSYIISIFGSICGHCYFDPAKDTLKTPKEKEV